METGLDVMLLHGFPAFHSPGNHPRVRFFLQFEQRMRRTNTKSKQSHKAPQPTFQRSVQEEREFQRLGVLLEASLVLNSQMGDAVAERGRVPKEEQVILSVRTGDYPLHKLLH
ncbi:hypothetical protein EK904_001805 [Melospiza melodia maxima]|nr:hypothetical protein EK904_001805 [Melospiza melodia maxima]